jgi:ABC-type glycerol-3-phosphate transport system permease component
MTPSTTPSSSLRRHRGRPKGASRLARKVAARAAAYTVLLVLACLTGFPLVWVVLTSFKQPQDVFSGPLMPASVSAASYQHAWSDLDFPRHFVNSAFVTLMTVVVVVIAGTLAAYVFARYRFPARDLLFYLILSCMMVPSAAILVPMFIFLSNLGLLNSLVGLSFSYLGTSLPFAIFVMRSFFLSVPHELGDAARIDGCTELGVFARIYLPISRPALATVIILQIVGTWNEFMFATTFVTDFDLTTLQTELYRFSGNWILMSAGVVMSITPLIVAYIAFQHQFIKGLTAGALHG